MTASVIARYVANVGIGWSDEAAELLFIWIVFVGFAVGVKHRAHVSVQLLVDRFPGKWRRATMIIQDTLVLVFSVVFAKESLVTVHFSFLQTMPGLQISMAWLYSATLVAGIMMSLYAAMNLWETIRGTSRHPDELGAGATNHSE
ncbi:MAG: TRAP transporter small permease [Candidatus Binataceae bacterium]|nr:TRAP transporter small permease [Candidatus Binataceae bacterium]